MDIKGSLENYNNYIVRIAVIDNQIFNLKQEEIECKNSKLDGMPKPTGFTESNLENQIINRLTKIEELETEKQQLNLEISIIDKLILTLKKYIQEIINMRYKEKETIEYISDKKGRSYRAIIDIIGKAIKDMQEAYNNSLWFGKNYYITIMLQLYDICIKCLKNAKNIL